MTGDGADNISKQNGGWTITWQGTGLNNADFPGGTSVWGGVKAVVKAGGGSAELSSDSSYKKKPDYAIVVFGENPYAEFQGDLKVQTLPGSMTQHLEIMKKLQDEKIPVVAILFSGRPLWQNRELNLANAMSRHGCRARKAPASPTCCSARRMARWTTISPASCRTRGRVMPRARRST